MHDVAHGMLRVGLLAGIFVTGCGRTTTGPVTPAEPLRLEVVLSASQGDPAHPVTGRATVTNLSRRSLRYGEGCSGPAIRVYLLDPEGRNVNYCGACPNNPCPLCPDRLVPLEPRESLGSGLMFTGALRDCDGPFMGPSGLYRVVIRFGAVADDGTPYSVSQTVEFHWTAE